MRYYNYNLDTGSVIAPGEPATVDISRVGVIAIPDDYNTSDFNYASKWHVDINKPVDANLSERIVIDELMKISGDLAAQVMMNKNAIQSLNFGLMGLMQYLNTEVNSDTIMAKLIDALKTVQS